MCVSMFMNKKKILPVAIITGSTGHIGGAIIEKL